MKKNLRLILLFSIFSCTGQNKLFQRYSDVNSENTFLFLPDSKYEFQYKFSHAKEHSNGFYRMNKEDIILNSEIQHRFSKAVIKESSNNKEVLYISIDGEQPKNSYKCEIFINDTLYKLSNSNILISTNLTYEQAEKEINVLAPYARYIRGDSIVELELSTIIKSISLKIIKLPSSISAAIYSYPIWVDKYSTKSKGLKKVEVNAPIDDSLFNYRIFTNERIRLKQLAINVYNVNTHKWITLPNRE